MTYQDDAKRNTSGMLRVLVYGTLKRGFANHDRFCHNAVDVQPATVCGRLYDLGSFPALEVPEETILAYGTADPCADVATQERFEAEAAQHPDLRAKGCKRRGWGLIRGELMTFDDAAERLPRLDRLEVFHPGGPSLYRRVLVPVFTGDEPAPAWAYVAGENLGRMCSRPLKSGHWDTERQSHGSTRKVDDRRNDE